MFVQLSNAISQGLKYLAIVGICILSTLSAKAYDFKVDGIYYLVGSMSEKTVFVTYGENKYSGSIAIPETVNYRDHTFRVVGIATSAFKGCSITSITLPNSMRLILYESFRNCRNLKSIDMPDSLVYIGVAAFKNSGLQSSILPDNLHVVSDSAFADCRALKKVVLGPKVGRGYGTRIYIPELKREFHGPLFSSVFANCKNVDELTIKDSELELETQFDSKPDNYAVGKGYPFIYDFVNLKTLYVGRCLYGPDRDFNLKFLANLEHLELNKYARIEPISSNLKTLKVHWRLPKKIERADYFTTKTKMDATLYVPKGSAKYYKEANGWKEFWNIVEMDN